MGVDLRARTLDCSIVYWGPAGAGKTENLAQLRHMLEPFATGPTEDELHVTLGEINGFQTALHLYAAPIGGPRAAELVGRSEGLVFVADSHPDRQIASKASLRSLQAILQNQGRSLAAVPTLFQYNKRDLPGAVPLEELESTLNELDVPAIDAVASEGTSVLEALCAIAERAVARL